MARTVPGAILSLADGAAHRQSPRRGRVTYARFPYIQQHVVLWDHPIQEFSGVTLALITGTLWLTVLRSRNLC